MGIVKKIEDGVKKWLWGKAFKKSIAKGVTLAVSWITSLGLSQYGIDVNQEAMTGAIYLGLDNLRSYIKLKYPKIGVWL